jgi:DNA polymerase III subunit epsilon
VRHLTLSRPLVFIDLETTGVSLTAARIIELGMIKVRPQGDRDVMVRRIHPGIPIPPESTQFHGIIDADVAGSPPFAEIASDVMAFIGEADLGGFNIVRFDLPVLRRELEGAGHTLSLTGRAVIDAQIIYHRKVPRDLAAAYRLYCGKELSNSHAAYADVDASIEVLDAQLGVYADLPRTPRELSDLFTPPLIDVVDPDGRFVWEGREAVFTFGPDGVRGRPLREVASKDHAYLRWILRKDFPSEVKTIAQDALAGRFPSKGRV